MEFTTTVELGGKTATGLEVPVEVVDALGGGKRPPVRVTVNGHSYRSTLGVRGGRSLIPLSAEHRAAAGVAAGDEVRVVLELDDAPRTVEVPDDLAAALSAAGLTSVFSTLSYSKQQAHVLSVAGARQAETRARRVTAVVAALAPAS